MLAHSRNVGIVRVVSSEIEKDDDGNIFIKTHVRRVETLRGKPYAIRTIRYHVNFCATHRLDVGDYFLLVTNNEGQDYMLGVFGENLVSLYTIGYMPAKDWVDASVRNRNESRTMTRLRLAIAGKGKLPIAEITDGLNRAGAMAGRFYSRPRQHR